jgi:hypothetical protein
MGRRWSRSRTARAAGRTRARIRLRHHGRRTGTGRRGPRGRHSGWSHRARVRLSASGSRLAGVRADRSRRPAAGPACHGRWPVRHAGAAATPVAAARRPALRAAGLAVAQLDGRRGPGYANRLQHADDYGPPSHNLTVRLHPVQVRMQQRLERAPITLTIAACATDATSSILASCRTPIASRASRRARFFGRDAGVAVRARRPPSPNRPWPMDRSSGR